MHSFREFYLMVVLSISTLPLHLPMQSVSITTKAESSITAHGKVYAILFYVVKFVVTLLQGNFLHIVIGRCTPIYFCQNLNFY